MIKATIFAIIAVAVIGGGMYYGKNYMQDNTNQTATPAEQNNINMNQNGSEGLETEDVETGSGPAAKEGDTVSVHYTGTFADGRKFDSSLDRGEPFSFTIGAGDVIEGWEKGVVGMQVGGTRKLVIPPALGYGPTDRGSIPGGSTLHFTIELLGIES
jgi:FKBP-type peptidyl-prolyl cis-trans isomerase